MAFVVEDGTGVPTANAFISVAFFKAYHDERGGDYSALTPDAKIEQVIVQATDYIQRRFGDKFVGARLTTTQALSWPRQYAYYPDGRAALLVPIEIQQATAEYALRAAAGPLAPDIVYDQTNAPVIEREERAGPIVERYKFGGGGTSTSYRKYPLADSLLKSLLVGGGEGYLLRA